VISSLSIETFEHTIDFRWELLDQEREVGVLIVVRDIAEEIQRDGEVCLECVSGDVFGAFLADVVDVIMKSPLEQGHPLLDVFDVGISFDYATPDDPAVLHKVIELIVIRNTPKILLNRFDNPSPCSLIHV